MSDFIEEMYGLPGSRENDITRRTLNPVYMAPELIQTQWAEAVELKKLIPELYKRKRSPIDVFDIGIGDGRVPIFLSGVKDIWNCVDKYDGIDYDGPILDKCLENVIKHNSNRSYRDKIVIGRFQFDARCLKRLPKNWFFTPEYDLVLSTYFTPGNFPPESYSFTKNEDVDDLEIKDTFQSVFKEAYESLLRTPGELTLGSVYKDNQSTARRQRKFYRNCGMKVISPKEAPFTATQEGFWSLRFTEERIMDYFDFVNPENIEIRPLDTYNFAMMVRVSK